MTPENLEIRHARVSDVEAILALERATDRAPHWPQTVYTDMLDTGNARGCLIVAQVGELIAGFAVGVIQPATYDSASSIAELESVAVAANARRAGIGRALCEVVIDWCRNRGATEMALEVRASSSGAISLYLGLGFEQIGRRPHYYRDPEDDAIHLRRKLVTAKT